MSHKSKFSFSVPDGRLWECYSSFDIDGDTTICSRQCKDGSGQTEINVCSCEGLSCSWAKEAECQYEEDFMADVYHPRQVTTTAKEFEGTTTTSTTLASTTTTVYTLQTSTIEG